MNERLTALDWLRGLVIVLMTIDHAGTVFDAEHLSTDSWAMYQGQELPLGRFLTRWITHLCAPTFVFLAGASIALSVAAQRRRGVSDARIDLRLVARGAFIALLDPTVVSWTWSYVQPFYWLFQVLFAIGVGMIGMALLRRLPARVLGLLALAFLVFGEVLTLRLWPAPWGSSKPVGFLLTLGFYGDPNGSAAITIYALVPWLAIMALGYAFGSRLIADREQGVDTTRRLVVWGVLAVVTFVVVRGLNGYGNMNLPRTDGSLAQWLHASKYPPSLSFSAMTLGAMALILAARFRYERKFEPPSDRHPLLLVGRVPMFFYLLHFPLLLVLRAALGREPGDALGTVWWASALVVVVLVPLCAWYGRWKRAHPGGWTRLV